MSWTPTPWPMAMRLLEKPCDMSWACGAPSVTQGAFHMAYLPVPFSSSGTTLLFRKAPDGEWRAEEVPSAQVHSGHETHQAPDCSTLVGLQQEKDCSLDRKLRIYHYTYLARKGHVLAFDLPLDGDKMMVIEWAPFPRAWPQVYALISQPTL